MDLMSNDRPQRFMTPVCLRSVQRRLLVFALLAIFWPAVRLTAAPPPGDLAEEVRAIARRAIDSNNAVGLSIGIARGDEVLLVEGYGRANLELAAPATADTVYRIGSLTKQFTAAAILLLVEEGRVELDAPITTYLPDYPLQDHTVTVRHLLHHISGIPSFTGLLSYRTLVRNDVTHEKLIARFKDLPLKFAPGKRFQYCNSGYYLLGMVIEAVTETSYAEFLQERLFDPLELKQTSYDQTSRIIPGRASGYRRVGGQFVNAPYISMTQPFAAGGLVSNVRDLLTWQRALMSDHVLAESSRKLMTTRGTLADGKQIAYGMGLVIGKADGRVSISHGGGIDGFRSHLAHFPESGYTIAVLTNSENGQPGPISKLVAALLFAD